MSLTGNVIDIQKIQLTDTFQTWFAKTNEMVDAINPVNIYDIDDGAGTNVTYGLSGTAYNGVKYVNVNAGYGVAIGGGSGKLWTGVVGLDLSSITGDAYTLTGNPAYTITGGVARDSEVNANDWFVVQDVSDTTQGLTGTTKKVQAKYMLPREVYQPTLDFWGDLNVRGKFYAGGAASTAVGNLSINSQYVYLATTGSATAGAYDSESALVAGGVILTLTGSGNTNKEFLWKYNSGNSYWSFSTPFGANEPNLPLIASKFISRNFSSGSTANTFIFEAANGQSNKLWLTESSSNPYFGIVKDTNSSNVNLNVYNGAGITSVAYIIAGATSQYTGVTANAFIRFANVDMVDGANATTGASAWTIPVSDQLGQIYAERHNAGQIKRRFTQTSHGLTTGEAVTVILTGTSAGTLTGAQANSASNEAIGIVDRVISANEVSVTMKGYYDLSANGLKGVGALAITGQIYYLDWNVKGGLTTSTSVPVNSLYQPMFIANTSSSGIVYGNEGSLIFPNASDEVYMRGMIPIGMIQPYAGPLAGLTMGLSAGTIDVSDVQYNQNYLPCDGRAIPSTGATGFVDLFNLIGYSYPMRGIVQSGDGVAGIVIRMDRGTSNLSSLSFGSGTVRAIRRSGTNSVNLEYSRTYTSFTADANTVTISGTGVTTQADQLGSGIIVDLLTPKNGSFFFLPDMRGKAPFGQYGPLGAIGEGFSLTAGSTGGTATGDGGLFTNYIIRSRRDSDAMILTGHNHDSRYLRKDLTDSISLAGSTLTLQNLNVVGNIAGIASAYTGLGTFNAGITSNHLYATNGVTFASTSVHTGLGTFNAGITSNNLYVTNGVTFASTSPSSSTNTGALVVAGGVGIGGSLYIGGGITATAAIYSSGNITAFSDRRLKENITNIESGLSKVVSLNGVQYTDIASQQRRTGLIAQDVLPVLPEAVHMNADGYYALAYGNMIGLLVEGIKELNAKVDSLSAKVEQLSSKGSE